MPIDDGRCFACGPENEIGLRLHFERAGEDAVCARTQLRAEFQGWQGIAHGGVALALLDEAMAHAAGAAGHRGVTASMSARFRKPVPLGVPIRVEGRVKWTRRNVLELQASVSDETGAVLVEGEGRFVSQGRIEDIADRRNPNAAPSGSV
ncbi:MAG TPA: PaaI family thioesterase [Candidatus Baltobacteraceae bacterium]|nr:PaaI family thioesterase [Candidatus Baltobacteraceae bacterium]